MRKDPASYLEDVEAFAWDLMGLRLLPHQVEFCLAEEEVITAYKGRQVGATIGILVKLAKAAATRPKTLCLYTSAGGRQAEDVGERFLDLTRGQPLARSIVSATQTTIRFSNGSIWHFLPSNPATLRGYSARWWGRNRKPGVYAVIDEAPHVEEGEKVKRAMQYAILGAPPGHRQLMMVGTPAGVTNWTYPYWCAGRDGEPGVRSFTFPTNLNPHADAGLIGRLRAMATAEERSQELDGLPVEGVTSLFPGVLLDPALFVAPRWPVPWQEGFWHSLGGDLKEAWSRGADRTALAVVSKGIVGGQEVWEVADLVVLDRHTNADVVEKIIRRRDAYRLQKILLERTAAGGIHEDLLMAGLPSELVSPTTGQQVEAFRHLYKLFEAGRIRIPRQAPYLESELRQCERRITPTGLPQFGHPLGSRKVHDDAVYAVLWACYALRDARTGSVWADDGYPVGEVDPRLLQERKDAKLALWASAAESRIRRWSRAHDRDL